ncbi:MAG: flavodoxin family protein [Candidatus Methanomethylicaceae archaeon]
MKYLVVFYSMGGATKLIAQKIAEKVNGDVEEIKDTKNRKGILGFLRSGYEGARRKLTVIAETRYDPSQYDVVIIGTPVWAGHMSSPTRTYIVNQRGKFNRVAFFCTLSMKDAPKIFKDMSKACQKEPVATVMFNRKEVIKGEYESKLNEFVSKLESLTEGIQKSS